MFYYAALIYGAFNGSDVHTFVVYMYGFIRSAITSSLLQQTF
jgi:hypothetical protein